MDDLYKIGVVAKRTGVSAECLRAWEMRHGFMPAERIGKTRFYSAAQVARLQDIKRLVDHGHPISQVIHLDEDEIAERLGSHRRDRAQGPGAHDEAAGPRIGLIGSRLVQAMEASTDRHARVVETWSSVDDFTMEEMPAASMDCLVVYMASLDAAELGRLAMRLPACRVAAAFKYATEDDLAQARRDGRETLRWPAAWPQVEALVEAALAQPVAILAPRYSAAELEHIEHAASQAGCECPRHLVELVRDLADYAEHAPRCASTFAHNAVQEKVLAAQGQLEQALGAFVEAHGLLAARN